jgi:hypothetical protein
MGTLQMQASIYSGLRELVLYQSGLMTTSLFVSIVSSWDTTIIFTISGGKTLLLEGVHIKVVATFGMVGIFSMMGLSKSLMKTVIFLFPISLQLLPVPTPMLIILTILRTLIASQTCWEFHGKSPRTILFPQQICSLVYPGIWRNSQSHWEKAKQRRGTETLRLAPPSFVGLLYRMCLPHQLGSHAMGLPQLSSCPTSLPPWTICRP